MTPRDKAARRAWEIEETLRDGTLSAEHRRDLESELGAIADNLAEGCYSNDPDDGIDWSDCPGISHTPEIVYKADHIKFYTPPMTYKLWYRNDEGRYTYDDRIPEDIIDLYRDHIAEALDDAYFFRLKHPNVTGVTPGVEVHYGELHGTLDVSLKGGLTQEGRIALREMLTDRTVDWSIYFEGNVMETSGGNLYVRFYDSMEPLMTDTVFTNRAYMQNCVPMIDAVKFYEDGDCLRMTYYNPDSEAGGQLVQSYLHLDDVKEAFGEGETGESFWERLDGRARQYLVDIDSPEFISEMRCFVEQPCDYSGQDKHTMEAIRGWADRQAAVIEQARGGMNMNY